MTRTALKASANLPVGTSDLRHPSLFDSVYVSPSTRPGMDCAISTYGENRPEDCLIYTTCDAGFYMHITVHWNVSRIRISRSHGRLPMPSKRLKKLERLAEINRSLYNHTVRYVTLLWLQPTNVNWRVVQDQARALHDERDRILAWFQRKGYPFPDM